ncbi:hypothetical protein Tco_0637693 [Tanacetum coccineum]
MARYGSRHRYLGQQVLDAHKDEGRLPETIRFTGTTRNTPLEMRKYSHEFYHKPAKDNTLLLHDLGHVKGITLERIDTFQQTGKLNPRYIRSFKILTKVGTVAYQLELPDQLSRAHTMQAHFIKSPVEIINERSNIQKRAYPDHKVCWKSSKRSRVLLESGRPNAEKYPHLFANPTSNPMPSALRTKLF